MSFGCDTKSQVEMWPREVTDGSTRRLLSGRASLATGRCEAPETTYPHPGGVAVKARADTATASIKAVGAQERVAWSTQVKRR